MIWKRLPLLWVVFFISLKMSFEAQEFWILMKFNLSTFVACSFMHEKSSDWLNEGSILSYSNFKNKVLKSVF